MNKYAALLIELLQAMSSVAFVGLAFVVLVLFNQYPTYRAAIGLGLVLWLLISICIISIRRLASMDSAVLTRKRD